MRPELQRGAIAIAPRFQIVERAARTRAPSWWRVLLAGAALWVASVVVTGVTGNLNLVPTVVLLGSFLVPVAAVLWYLDHYESDVATGRAVFNAFVVGGVLGVLAASLLEAWLVSGGVFAYLVVGLIEELAKLLALVAVAWRLPKFRVRDGVVLGAAVGFGFAALESAGYALTALLAAPAGHLSLAALVGSELVRGALAPLGHGLWTAILGGVLFAASRKGRFRITFGVLFAYLAVALLHGWWDSMRFVAALLTVLVTRSPNAGVFAAFDLGGYAAISLLGLLSLALVWRRSRSWPHLERG